MLWNQQRAKEPPPGSRYGLKIGRGARNFSGIALLANRGLAEVGKRDQTQVHLTPAGLEFCATNEAEIEAHPIFTNPPTRANLTGVSLLEKRLLRLLWLQQKKASATSDAHPGLKISPASPVYEAREPLAARGLVELGSNPGVIHLTDEGRAFCAANLMP